MPVSVTFRITRWFFFFNDTATTEIYTLSLHDALPISRACALQGRCRLDTGIAGRAPGLRQQRSEEHTSELQSHSDLVCRLLLEKKKHAMSDRTTLQEAARGESEPVTPAADATSARGAG